MRGVLSSGGKPGGDDLQKKETWPKLRGIARIKPDNDALPFRTKYESHDAPETGIVGDEPTISIFLYT